MLLQEYITGHIYYNELERTISSLKTGQTVGNNSPRLCCRNGMPRMPRSTKILAAPGNFLDDDVTLFLLSFRGNNGYLKLRRRSRIKIRPFKFFKLSKFWASTICGLERLQILSTKYSNPKIIIKWKIKRGLKEYLKNIYSKKLS